MHFLSTRGKRAFTLVELIVVVVIMGVLVAIGAFAYNSVINSSKSSAAEKRATQVARTIRAVSAAGQVTYGSLLGVAGPFTSEDVARTGAVATADGAGNLHVSTNGFCVTISFAPNETGTAPTSMSAPVEGTCHTDPTPPVVSSPLVISPASGSQDTPISATLNASCPANAQYVLVTFTGPGLDPENTFNVPFVLGAPMDFAMTMRQLFEDFGAPGSSGAYTVTADCIGPDFVEVLDRFSQELVFTATGVPFEGTYVTSN